MKIKKTIEKREKFRKAIKAIPRDKIANEDLLSHDLAARVGSLGNKLKKIIHKLKNRPNKR